MTHFKLSDEVVDVALRASFVKVCELEGKPFDEDEYQGRKSKADNSARQQAKEMIRASIEAALPVMFEQLGWWYSTSHGPVVMKTKTGSRSEPLFRLKESK